MWYLSGVSGLSFGFLLLCVLLICVLDLGLLLPVALLALWFGACVFWFASCCFLGGWDYCFVFDAELSLIVLILWFLCIEVFGFVFGLCICVGCACCDLFDSDLWFIAGVCVFIECWSLSGWFFGWRFGMVAVAWMIQAWGWGVCAFVWFVECLGCVVLCLLLVWCVIVGGCVVLI